MERGGSHEGHMGDTGDIAVTKDGQMSAEERPRMETRSTKEERRHARNHPIKDLMPSSSTASEHNLIGVRREPATQYPSKV